MTGEPCVFPLFLFPLNVFFAEGGGERGWSRAKWTRLNFAHFLRTPYHCFGSGAKTTRRSFGIFPAGEHL